MRAFAIVALTSAFAVANDELEREFAKFAQEFHRSYSAEERPARFVTFSTNYRIIQEENAKNNTFQLGLNEFSDLTMDEFAATHFGYKSPRKVWGDLPNLGTHEYSGALLPDAVDWTSKGAVTPIKDQKSCGSCWAFSTTGALEGAHKVSSGTLVSLSEQQFVDCDKSDDGCGGGLMDSAFNYAEGAALCTEESYPYKGTDGSCHASGCTVGIPSGSVTGFKDVKKDDTNSLMEAVAQQPVSVAVDANNYYFMHYKNGVINLPCGDNLDHGVLLVGYGSENNQTYWKVKNSWGSSWGESGYVRLLRGKGTPPWGECGIKEQASYPVVSSSAETLV